jgi:hypothetical protein
MHVPLGFARNLALPPPRPEDQRDIDVLFFGGCPSPWAYVFQVVACIPSIRRVSVELPTIAYVGMEFV